MVRLARGPSRELPEVMSSEDDCAALVRERDLDRYLATLYAPPAARPGLFALHALDLDLAEVVRTTTEPMLGQIRLAWWREQLQALDAGARPAQPVLAALADNVLPRGVTGASLEPLEDANLALLEEDLAGHAVARSRLFEAALCLLVPAADTSAVEWVRSIGEGWAIVDVLRTGHPSTGELLETARRRLGAGPAPRGARPLGGLAALARTDLAALCAGRRPSARGMPGRQARLLWSIVTGR